MRKLVSRLVGISLACLASGAAEADDVPADFMLSLMRFGIQCQQATAPRKTYLGDAKRFAVSVEQASAPAEGEKPVTTRTTYRAFYRDLREPNVAQGAVTLRCKAQAPCIAVNKGGEVERANVVQLETCSPRTATLVSGAAREFIKSAAP